MRPPVNRKANDKWTFLPNNQNLSFLYSFWNSLCARNGKKEMPDGDFFLTQFNEKKKKTKHTTSSDHFLIYKINTLF